jgi:hypothetical protein
LQGKERESSGNLTGFGWYAVSVRLVEPGTMETPVVAPVVSVALAPVSVALVSVALMPTGAVSVTLVVSITGKVALVSIGSNLIILPFDETI